MLGAVEIEQYLRRIRFEGSLKASATTLDELVRAHQLAVPFETVTLHRTGELPATDVESLFDRIVVRRGGGYCFQLNKLFEELLASVGYEVRPVLSRAVRGRSARMPINHRGIVVSLPDGDRFVDVGFGGPMAAGSLQLVHGIRQDVRGETFFAMGPKGGWWNIERVTKAAADLYDDDRPECRQVELAVCDAVVHDEDFDALNKCFSAPGTLFHDHELVNLRTEGGYLAYKDGVLTIRENGEKRQIECKTRAEADEILSSYFGL